MNSRDEAKRMEDCYESLSNRQVIALPTPLTNPCQLAMVKLPHPSDVRHPRCVLYNSKELSVVIHTVKHNYICLCYYNESSNNNMFQPYMWAIFRLLPD